METNRGALNKEEMNKDQIIRMDKQGCLIESKRDGFSFNKAHLEFATYDKSKAVGERYTNHVHIYIDIPHFLQLTNESLTGTLHARMLSYKKSGNREPLFETMGGTAARKLRQPRADGMSVSRIAKLQCASKYDYFFTADSGPGREINEGLIVPTFGRNPENHVSIGLTWRELDTLLLMTKVHYESWLTAQYLKSI